MVPNNGTLSRALARPEGWNKSRSGRAPNQQLIGGHRLVQGHLEATIVVKSRLWHSCCWWAPPTPNPPHSVPKTPLRSRGITPPPRSGGGWEGVVPNNGTLSSELVETAPLSGTGSADATFPQCCIAREEGEPRPFPPYRRVAVPLYQRHRATVRRSRVRRWVSSGALFKC